MWFTIFDPRLTDDFAEALECGVIGLNPFQVDRSPIILLDLQQSTVEDKVGAIDLPKTPTSNCDAKSFSEYNTYSFRMNTIGAPLNISTCTKSSPDYKSPCYFTTRMTMSSMLVTSQTSTRGTNWQKILFDEGSIVGGIMFVTWFLGIYII
jgi:hypothetical protein